MPLPPLRASVRRVAARVARRGKAALVPRVRAAMERASGGSAEELAAEAAALRGELAEVEQRIDAVLGQLERLTEALAEREAP